MEYVPTKTLKWCMTFVYLLEGLMMCSTEVQFACVGKNNTIICPENNVYRWQNLSSHAILASCENKIQVHSSVSVSDDCKRLRILNFSKNDVGSYRCYCTVNTKQKTYDTTMVIKSLEIVEANEFNVIERNEGETITLTCLMKYTEREETIQWKTKDTILISKRASSISYQFKTQQSDDKKQYICTVISENNSCIHNASVQLNLIFKPRVSVIITPGPTVKEGQPIKLLCEDKLSENKSLDNVCWKHNQKELPNKRNVLEFETVTRYNAGEYMCTIYNTAGEDTDLVNITVTYPPYVQKRNDTFRTNKRTRIITCNVMGVPSIYTFKAWQHHTYSNSFIRELYGDTNGTLTLPELDSTEHLYEDSGIYTYNVSNGISDEEDKLWQIGQIRMIVEEKPVVVKPKTHLTYGHFNETSIISIFVLSSSKIANAKWSNLRKGYPKETTCTSYIDETEFHRQLVNVSGYKCELLIQQTKEKDFKCYTVDISNTFGNTTFEIHLKSAQAPEIPSNIRLFSGTNYIVVEFQPGFHGGSKQTFILEYRKKLTKHWISHEIKRSNTFYQRYKIEYLNPSTEFELRMFSQNKQGNSSVTRIYSKFTSDEIESSGTKYIIGCTFSLIFLVSLVVFIWWRLKKAKKRDSQRGVRENDQNEPGVVAVNNLYGSTNELNVSSASDGRTDVYSAINRREKMLDRQKVTYNIAGEGKRSQVKLTDAKQWKTNVASGSSELNYIEVEFGLEQPKGNYFIHGDDNRMPYADIDFLAKAEPLISSDEDNESIAGGDDNGDDFMTLEDVQQWNITVD